MKIKMMMRFGAAAALMGAIGFMPACAHDASYGEAHPDPSEYRRGDGGLQSKDVIVMSESLAPKLIQIPEVAQNPYRVSIVVTDMQNQTRTLAGQNLNIFTDKMQGVLFEHATQHVSFIERRATTAQIQQQEGGGTPDLFEEGSRNGIPAPTQKTAQYALYGTVEDMPNNTSTYYFCNFKLTDMATGQIVWIGTYETKTGSWVR